MRRFPLVEAALQENPNCRVGLMLRPVVVYTPQGPFGGEELLALVYAGDPTEQYWYGHVCRHPSSGTYAAALVFSEKLVNAETIELLFRRFQYWISCRLFYEPCAVQADGDAFALAATFDDAVDGLVTIIRRFGLDNRCPQEARPGDRTELRLLSLYGVEGERTAQGEVPPVPMAATTQPSLMLVGGRDYG